MDGKKIELVNGKRHMLALEVTPETRLKFFDVANETDTAYVDLLERYVRIAYIIEKAMNDGAEVIIRRDGKDQTIMLV